MGFKHKAIVILFAFIFMNGEMNASFTSLNASRFINQFKLTGRWKLNFELSELGRVPRLFAFKSMEIKQIKDSIEIIRYSDSFIEFGEEQFIKQTFPLNGQQSIYMSKVTKGIHTSSISWIENRNIMTLNTVMKYPEIPDQVYQKSYNETWELSSDGRSLIVIRNMKLSDDKLNWITKCIYNKI